MPNGERLTQKQETFCVKYFELGNATQAAIQAGYSKRTAQAIAAENLTKPLILARMGELRKQVEDESVASVLERRQRLTEMIRANLVDFIDEGGNINLDTQYKGALAELTVEDWKGISKKGYEELSRNKRIKLHNAIQAITELNKMDRVYEEGSTAQAITVILQPVGSKE